MERVRTDGLCLLLLGCVAFLTLGVVWGNLSSNTMTDYRTAYSSAKCLLHGCDPYNPNDVLRMYRASADAHPQNAEQNLFVITHNVYPPSEFAVTLPFSALPINIALVLWGALIAACVLMASFLMWIQGARHAPIASGCLLCFFLANSSSLMIFGNPAGLAISLCVIAVWCFLNERFILLGILCLAVSLCLKPQDAGLVWLYFLLTKGASRKYALQTLAVAAAISIPFVLWIARLSPHWIGEMSANLLAFTRHGGINDPGPATSGGRGFHMITDLQAVFSFIWDNPRFYNLASYALCAPLLVLWSIPAVRSRASQNKAWLGLATIAALSMLPIYHRQYDAKLILLTIPACTILMAEGGRVRQWALAITGAAFILNGDFTWIVLIHFLTKFNLVRIVPYFDLLACPVPLSLLVLGTFYLWVYSRPARETKATGTYAL
jgi:hypothetical protein